MEMSNNFTEEIKGISGIYKIINNEDGKIYVGSAINFYGRFYQHKNKLLNNKHYNKYLQNSWNKYGKECFTFELIEIVDEADDLIDREQYWIDKLNVIDKKIGYNICSTAGSTLGVKASEEKTKRHGISMKKYFENITPEQAERRALNISKGKLAKKQQMSKESRMKMSISKKGKNTGKRPKEVGEKISISKMGHTYTPLGSEHWKSIYTEEDVTKIKLMLFDGYSVNEVSIETGIKTSAIYDIKSGRTWTHILSELDLSKNNRSGKLNVKKVREIKLMLKDGINQKVIAEKYGISVRTVKDINIGKTWSNVDLGEVV